MVGIRAVICSVLGHVDHGKSSILDTMRGTAIVKSEPGQITQSIGASIMPRNVIEKVCGPLLQATKLSLTIPGLLFIDTPGHAAFTNLRKRGGNLADIAILVVDIREGFMPQTLEAIDILRHYKTPFIVAANKIDLLPGWQSGTGALLGVMAQQPESVQRDFETRMYALVGKLAELGFASERFDRVESYAKQVAIVPCSAKTGDGMAEMLMVIAGLGQRFLESSLRFDAESPARGTILEVKKDKGLGTTLDVIIYDGTLRRGDTIVMGSLDEPVVTKVRALFEPKPLHEMRDRKAAFTHVESVTAATGVKVSAIGVEHAVAGMPIIAARGNVDALKEAVMRDVESVTTETNADGVVVKADSLGSLEAMMFMLREKDIPVRKAMVGNITRKDIADAESTHEKSPLLAAVLGFNVQVEHDAQSELGRESVTVLTSPIIYTLVEQFQQWQETQRKRREQEELADVTRPCKVQLLKGYVFRQRNPAVVGVEVLVGTLKSGMSLAKDGHALTTVKAMQEERDSVSEAQAGKQVAVSLDRVSVGRHINEGDVLYSDVSEDDFRALKMLKALLKPEEILLLKEIAAMKRRDNPVWGV